MGINPIQGFKNMSTKKKVAVVAGTAAAVGTVALAYATGRKTDKFILLKDGMINGKSTTLNVFQTIAEGFKDLAQFAKYKFTKLKAGFIKGAPTDKQQSLLNRLYGQEAFATGMTKRSIEKVAAKAAHQG